MDEQQLEEKFSGLIAAGELVNWADYEKWKNWELYRHNTEHEETPGWTEFKAWINGIVPTGNGLYWEPEPKKSAAIGKEGSAKGHTGRPPDLDDMTAFSKVCYKAFDDLYRKFFGDEYLEINENEAEKIVSIYSGRARITNGGVKLYTWPAHIGQWIFKNIRFNTSVGKPYFCYHPTLKSVINKKTGKEYHIPQNYDPNWQIALWYSAYWHVFLMHRTGTPAVRGKAAELVRWLFQSYPKDIGKGKWIDRSSSKEYSPQNQGGNKSVAIDGLNYRVSEEFFDAKNTSCYATCNSTSEDWILWFSARYDQPPLNKSLNSVTRYPAPQPGFDDAKSGVQLIKMNKWEEQLDSVYGLIDQAATEGNLLATKGAHNDAGGPCCSRTDKKIYITAKEIDTHERIIENEVFRHWPDMTNRLWFRLIG